MRERELRDQPARDRIVTDTASTLFVDAGAGSGKTRALVNRVQTLVLTDGVPMRHIAAVTFTEKAAAELRDRLRERFEAAVTEREGDATAADRATAALDELDAAPIGTLHSFARRILSEHPIEAKLPPVFEVSDEIASSIAFAERWEIILTELLDAGESSPLAVARAQSVSLDHLRTIARALGSDWDLITDRIPVDDPDRAVDWDRVIGRIRSLATEFTDDLPLLLAAGGNCSNPANKLLERIEELREVPAALAAAGEDPVTVLGVLGRVDFSGVRADGTPTNVGAKSDWSDIDAVRQQRADLLHRLRRGLGEVKDQVLRAVTETVARQVLAAAEDRRREGRLEFQDLLVISRDLLRHHPAVRAALAEKYRYLLLDEFQDTDLIQIELAVRIAGGHGADQLDWRDVDFPAGSIFVVGDPKQSIYRFRRADIATYLSAAERLGDRVTLATNFRTVPAVVDWVNRVFGELIEAQPDQQPAYEALDAYRTDQPAGPAVTVLGAEEGGDRPAAELRAAEARDIADAIAAAHRGWQVRDRQTGELRPAEYRDIAVLIPSRTSLEDLELALDRAGIPYHAEASSLVYESAEVRDLLITARAAADPADTLALVTALRSPLFGCGDDDLFRWKRDGNAFTVFAEAAAVDSPSPVGRALAALAALNRRARWATPSEVLGAVITECRMLEVTATGPRAEERWGRVRFVLDQARAWTDVSSGGLRDYLAWVGAQAADTGRVTESVAGELGLDSVRILTVHVAKGLEFPIVAMSGMTGRPRNHGGPRVLWPTDGGYEVKIGRDTATADFDVHNALDVQMDRYERIRLLYVAATRARDHLIVSLHRNAPKTDATPRTPAMLLAEAGAVEGATVRESREAETEIDDSGIGRPDWTPPPPLADWLAEITAAREQAGVPASISASGLEGTEPEEVLAERAAAEEAGLAKGGRDLDLPPWSKGRYGSEIGRAVHGVLQVVELAGTGDIDDAVGAQCVAEGVVGSEELVAELVRSALAAPLVRHAATRQHWRETFVGTVDLPGTGARILEGFIDLMFRDDDGTLVIVDYKTDAIPAGAIDSRDAYYRPQVEAYAKAIERATGSAPRAHLLYLHPQGAVDRLLVGGWPGPGRSPQKVIATGL